MSEKRFTLSIKDNPLLSAESEAWLKQTEDAIHEHVKNKWAAVEKACEEAMQDRLVYGVAMAKISHKPNGDIIIENSLRKWVVTNG